MLSTHLLPILPLLATLPTSFAFSHAQDLALLHSGHPQISLWQTLHKHQKVQQDQALAASFNQDKSQVTFSTTKGDGERGGGGGSEDNPAEDPTKYKPHCFNQPLDHFDPENPVTFCQRYWVSLSHWNSSNPSAPVIILDGGETSGQNRLAFLESGIINILSNSTGGIGIILEHRYYGDSLPNTTYPDGGKMSFSTDDLRFLNNEQAEMDNVRFLQGLDLSHLEIPAEEALNSRQSKGSDEKDDSKKGKVVGKALGFDAMRADQRPYIYYGGSYAGARAAHMIKGWGYDGDKLSTIPPPHPSIPWQTTKLPPAPTQGKISLPGGSIVIINSTTGSGSDSDKGKTKGLIWGSIASSAVTHAQVRYSEYHQAIQEWAPPKCMRTLEDVVEVLDTLLEFQGGVLAKRIQALFGLEDLEHRDDFMEVLASAHGGWQSRNWDPAVGSEGFYEFCDALTADGGEGEGEGKDGGFLMNVEGLLVAKLPILRIPRVVMNYAGWVKEHVVTRCPTDDDGKQDIEDCFGSYDEERYKNTGLDQTWRLWLFQVATQWGYYMPAPLEGKRILSKFIDLDYTMKTGRMAFPPGKYFTVPEYPDVESVNARGDFDLAVDRLAFIDGDSDPWRPATPGSDYASVREDTILRPVRILEDAVHHYDENGLLDPSKEPERIQEIHRYEMEFVGSWIKDWHKAEAADEV